MWAEKTDDWEARDNLEKNYEKNLEKKGLSSAQKISGESQFLEIMAVRKQRIGDNFPAIKKENKRMKTKSSKLENGAILKYKS